MEVHWSDYLIFAVFLASNIAIGLYHNIRGTSKQVSQQEMENFFVGGRRLNYFPVALSMVMSFMSSISALGNPAHVYTKGTMLVFVPVGSTIGTTLAGFLFVPLLYPLRLTSTNEVCHENLDFRTSLN